MRALAVFALIALAACTPGGIPPSSSSVAGTPGATTYTIDVNLTQHAMGYLPDSLTVPVGSIVQFHNSDGFAHTATLIPGATGFPASSPFTAAAENQSGNVLSMPWSTGALSAGATSQSISVDRAGTYYFACFFHYGAPMHGTIVAQ